MSLALETMEILERAGVDDSRFASDPDAILVVTFAGETERASMLAGDALHAVDVLATAFDTTGESWEVIATDRHGSLFYERTSDDGPYDARERAERADAFLSERGAVSRAVLTAVVLLIGLAAVIGHTGRADAATGLSRASEVCQEDSPCWDPDTMGNRVVVVTLGNGTAIARHARRVYAFYDGAAWQYVTARQVAYDPGVTRQAKFVMVGETVVAWREGTSPWQAV